MKSYRTLLLGVGLAAAVSVAIIGIRAASREGDQRLSDESSRSVTLPPAEEQRRSELLAGGDGRTEIESVIGERSASEWTSRFHSSTDYSEFVSNAAPEAAAGDARAQFLVAEVLGECHNKVSLYEKRYPDQTTSPAAIFEEVFWENADPSLPSPYVELSRRDFMKCAEFFAGDPPVLDDLQIGLEAHTRDYWMALALQNGDPLAVMQESLMLTTRLDGMDEESRTAAVERIRKGVSLAVDSADPEALYQIGIFIAYAGASDPEEGPAWTLAACEVGYDCTYANPVIGQGCIELGLCSGGESVPLSMQRDSPSLYGRAYARSQDIVYALEQGQGTRVLEELLKKLEFEE